MKHDFKGKLPHEVFTVFLHVQIQALLMSLVFASAWGGGWVGHILARSLSSSTSIEFYVFNGWKKK